MPIDAKTYYIKYVNRKRTDNTMAKIKKTKRQTMIYKTLNRKLKIEKQRQKSYPYRSENIGRDVIMYVEIFKTDVIVFVAKP
jgi:hypothetical protein